MRAAFLSYHRPIGKQRRVNSPAIRLFAGSFFAKQTIIPGIA
jgi:hypothetical protein